MGEETITPVVRKLPGPVSGEDLLPPTGGSQRFGTAVPPLGVHRAAAKFCAARAHRRTGSSVCEAVHARVSYNLRQVPVPLLRAVEVRVLLRHPETEANVSGNRAPKQSCRPGAAGKCQEIEQENCQSA